MRFMMLLKSDANAEAGVMPDAEILVAMGKYNEELIKAGAMLDGNGLQGSSQGFRVKHSGGNVTVTDGPFPEVKELIAGYWMIKADSLQEAIEWAKRVPFEADGPSAMTATPGEGQIEIRQVVELDEFPVNENESGWREQEEAFREQGPSVEPVPGKMQFMMLMKANAQSESGALPDEKVLAEMGAGMQEMIEAGVLLGGEGLHPSSKGARVYFSNGKRTVVDGPFAETKDLIAGYTIIQVDSKEEAIEWARKGVVIGGADAEIEGRRIFLTEDFPAELQEQVPEVFEAERQFRERAGQ